MLYDPFQPASFSPSLSLSLPLYVSFSASLSCVCLFLFPLSIHVSSSSLPLLPSSVLLLSSVLTPEVVFLCNQSPETVENDTTFLLRCRSFLRSSCFSPTGQALLFPSSHTAQSQPGAFPLPAPARESLSCSACSRSSPSSNLHVR